MGTSEWILICAKTKNKTQKSKLSKNKTQKSKIQKQTKKLEFFIENGIIFIKKDDIGTRAVF